MSLNFYKNTGAMKAPNISRDKMSTRTANVVLSSKNKNMQSLLSLKAKRGTAGYDGRTMSSNVRKNEKP
jgi:hypothetical protein